MNIFIPLCGKGERFQKEGYTDPKPLIQVLDKPIFFYVLDSLHLSKDDTIYILYHTSLDSHDFTKRIKKQYSQTPIYFIPISTYTKGASETLYTGITYCLTNDVPIDVNKWCACFDCDTFYTNNILNVVKKQINKTEYSTISGAVIYTHNTEQNPIYSYIQIDNNGYITCIKEKEKCSDFANTGIYCFKNYELLLKYAYNAIQKETTTEPYISYIIHHMLSDGNLFIGIEIPAHTCISLGTPRQVHDYTHKTHGFLFDLDGTLVQTDDVYLEVWKQILQNYNIECTKECFSQYIQGNNDTYVTSTLLKGTNINVSYVSTLKDTYFIQQIDKIKIIKGALSFIHTIKEHGHKIAIVTNCNRKVAEEILKFTNINLYTDYLIIGNECEKAKPHPHPYLKAIERINIDANKCIIFEDSKTGLLSGKSIYPKSLIAVESVYTKDDYTELGVDKVITEYTTLNVSELISNNSESTIENLQNSIYHSVKLSNCFPNETIQRIIIDSAKLKGGYITDAVKVSIKTQFKTYHCVLKIENKQVSSLSTMANALHLYDREYYFYTNISKLCPISIPKFYTLIYHHHTHEIIGILLENLYTKDCILNLNLNISSIDTTLQIVSECAKLHSFFWNKECDTIFTDLKRHDSSLFKPTWENFLKKQYHLFTQKWSHFLTQEYTQIFDKVISNFNIIQTNLSKEHLTLCHGDVKSPNLFYKPIKNGYKPYFIDWQYIAYGKGVQDIVFFLIESFDIDRVPHIVHIVKEYYYTKLVEYGIKGYTREQYTQDFITSIFHFPLFVAIWFGTTPQDDLIDKNFPFFFIQKLLHFISIFIQDVNMVLSVL